MNFTFKQLEAFLASARLGSFSAAAAKLHTTQSAISKRVAELESLLGRKLLHRAKHGLNIAPAGLQLIPLAEETMALTTRIQKEVSDDQTLRGTVRFGVTELIGLTWLTALIEKAQELHPELVVEPVVDVGLTLLEMVRTRKLDLAVMPGKYWGEPFATSKIASLDQVWVASPTLRVPHRVLKPHEFAQFQLIDHAIGGSKAALYEEWRAQHKFIFGRVMTCNSVGVLRELTARGFGVSQMNLVYVRRAIRDGVLRVVRSDPTIPPTTYVATSRRDNASGAITMVVDLATKFCDFTTGTQY